MELKFHKQETKWTCGPACMKIVLDSLGIKRSEKLLAKLMKTNKIWGTRQRSFPFIAERYKLNYTVKRNSRIDFLKKLLKQEYRIIICYHYPGNKASHYAIVKKITKEKVTLMDPWHGANFKFDTDFFAEIWRSSEKYGNEIRWLIAIK